MSHPLSAAQLVHDLSSKIDDALAPLIPAGERVALLDFPNHNNVGDNAIWLGETRWLANRRAELVYTCDLASYCESSLRRRIAGGIILLHGGGNFGTAWPRHQAFRERIVSAFPDHRIVQLPQTVDFADPAAAERARQAMCGHPDLTVLARDDESLSHLRQELGLQAALCPDMAFMLGTWHRLPAVRDIVWLERSDHESLQETTDVGAEIERVDWLRGEPGRPWSSSVASVTVRTRNTVNAAMVRAPWLRRLAGPALSSTFGLLAWRRFQRGRRILSRGRVVVTDRLHGHILSLLLDIPHVLLDNRFGKIGRFHRAFTRDCGSCRVASGPAAAVEIAREMLRAEGSGRDTPSSPLHRTSSP